MEEEKSNRESLIALLFVIPSPRSRIHERMIPCVCTLLVLRPTQVVVLFITCLNPGTCTTPWVKNNKFRYLINNVFIELTIRMVILPPKLVYTGVPQVIHVYRCTEDSPADIVSTNHFLSSDCHKNRLKRCET